MTRHHLIAHPARQRKDKVMKSLNLNLLLTAGMLLLPQKGQANPTEITLAQARTIALRAAPGRIEKAEREREGGGMRYSFDIRQGGRIHEIGVDAVTGTIVEDKFEATNARD
jgi:uncharacterized membrane protein YkoI